MSEKQYRVIMRNLNVSIFFLIVAAVALVIKAILLIIQAMGLL